MLLGLLNKITLYFEVNLNNLGVFFIELGRPNSKQICFIQFIFYAIQIFFFKILFNYYVIVIIERQAFS